MKRPSIKASMVGIFVLIGIIFGGFAAMSLSAMSSLNGSTHEIAVNWLPSVEVVKNMKIARGEVRMTYAKHILSLTPEAMAEVETEIAAKNKASADAIKAYEPLISSDREAQLLKDISAGVAVYEQMATKMLELSRANKNEDATKVFGTVMAEQAKLNTALVDELVQINLDGAKHASEKSVETYTDTANLMYLLIGFSALIVVGAVFFVMSGVVKPITRITSSMSDLAGGDTATGIPFAGRADEIGEMAGAVDIFRQAAISNKRLEQEAEASRVQAEADRIRLTAEAEAAAQKRLQEATSGLAAGLRRLAAGDLAFELNEPFAPDFEALRHDLNAAVAQLGETLRAVAQSTVSLDSGTREIGQSAEDLSKRTEQQAASLEETAAALDQITVNVTNSSKRADEARTIAVQANRSATQSGAVVADAVDAMGRIEQSSNQISNIIGVIDEIAFQTNLLALNAGVEAARAGDAGKGFAVVAQEVRELAQRSAQAAKEIKDLIRNSSVEVQSGVKLVRETGDALKTIEGFVVTINHHMDAIATSAREQSVGLSEVNTAVNQMDQVTQQNAAMVEETNAASATLANEAGRLRELISQFQLGGNGSSQAAALRQTASVMASSSQPRRTAAATRPVSHGNVAVKQEEWAEF